MQLFQIEAEHSFHFLLFCFFTFSLFFVLKHNKDGGFFFKFCLSEWTEYFQLHALLAAKIYMNKLVQKKKKKIN